MEWLNKDIAKLPRLGDFPFRVRMLYFSHRHTVVANAVHGVTPESMVEFSIRLEPRDAVCRDTINGVRIRENFPNMVWKLPGGHHLFLVDRPRDAISFGYPAERIEEFRRLGLWEDRNSISFVMTPEIERLAAEYRKLCLQLHTPGVADKIDWCCFLLYREILYSRHFASRAPDDDAGKIRNISVWLQVHYSQPVDLDEIARVNGFSRSSFFRKWRRIFPLSPVQYLLELKLQAAERFLLETDMPIGAIVREINFSGTTAFHRRFRRRFGMSPDEFRKCAGSEAPPSS